MRDTARLLAAAEARMYYRRLGLIPEVEDDCPDPICTGYYCRHCNGDRTRGED